MKNYKMIFMDGFDRIYDLHQILKNRKTPVSCTDILREMECSRATFNRVKRHMTDFLGAPIEYNRSLGGYFYNESQQGRYELPGVWFEENELHALLLIQELIENLGVGLLNDALYPLKERFHRLLKKGMLKNTQFEDKFRILGVGQRSVSASTFKKIAVSTLNKVALQIKYIRRNDAVATTRIISPQRIINYRNNWYVDTWCHARSAYRTFALESIGEILDVNDTYVEVEASALDNYFQQTYGIYAGNKIEKATILFTKPLAQRVAEESWHPQQEGFLNNDGCYVLTLPYNSDAPEELLMDIARYGINARIISPTSLQQKMASMLSNILALYEH